MTNTVIGFFDHADSAQDAVNQLLQAGFDRSNIDVNKGNAIAGHTATTNDSANSEKGNAISRFFSSLFGDDSEEANRYSTRGQQSDSIVTVHTISDDQAEQAADILDACGAADVEENSAGSAKMYADSGSGQTPQIKNDQSGDTIQRIEEELQVGKRLVSTGGVRVRSRIVAKPVEESLRLRSEQVTVDRKVVDRPVTAADWDNFKEGEIEMTESAEVPVVSKTARVVEEIRINKEVNERVESVKDTVRRTEVDIEDLEGKNKINPEDYTSK